VLVRWQTRGGDNKPQSCRWMPFPSVLLVLTILYCLSAAEVKRAACHTGGSFLEDDAPLRRADQDAEDPSRTLGRQEAGGRACRCPLGLAVGNFHSSTHKFFFLSLSSVRAGNRGVKSGVDVDIERGWLWRRDLEMVHLGPSLALCAILCRLFVVVEVEGWSWRQVIAVRSL
jgi:hypothetical protein